MTVPRILTIEDNEVTRRLLRATLEAAGYEALEAADAREGLSVAARERPDLILQDTGLPDMKGTELAQKLRALPGLSGAPILAMSGAASDGAEPAFDGLLHKPVEPEDLLHAIGAHLAPAQCAGRGRRVLIADDDPLQLKLAALCFTRCGFEVQTARDGAEALTKAKSSSWRPDAIVCDVLMPEIDGFVVCSALRADSDMAGIPIVLVTSNYLAEEDERLAFRAGAAAFVRRTSDNGALIATVVAAMQNESSPPPDYSIAAAHASRVGHQVVRQAALNAVLAQRVALQDVTLSVISSLAHAVGRDGVDPVAEALSNVLHSSGLSGGAVYLRNAGGSLRAAAVCGLSDADRAALDRQIARPSLAAHVIDRGEWVLLPDEEEGTPPRSSIAMPVQARGEVTGVLVLATRELDLVQPEWLSFARATAVQIGHAVALERLVRQLAASEKRYRTLMANAHDAISVLTPEGVLLEVNHHLEAMVGRSRAEMLGRSFSEFVPPETAALERQQFERVVAEGSIEHHDIAILRPDGGIICTDWNYKLVQLGDEKVVMAIGRDVTERNRAHEEVQLLHKVALAASEADDLHSALRVVLIHIGEVTGLEMGVAWLPNAARTHLDHRCIWTKSGSDEDAARYRQGIPATLARGEGQAGTAWQTAKPFWCVDLKNEARTGHAAQCAAQLGLRSCVTVPVLLHGEVVAVLQWLGTEPRAEEERVLNLVLAVAAQVGSIIRRKSAEEALRASEEQVRLLLDSTGEAIYGIDLEGNCTFANAACVHMLGYRHQRELIGKHMHRVMHHTREDGAPYPAEQCRIYRAGLKDEGCTVDDEVFWRADGAPFAAEYRCFPVRRGAERVGAVVSFVDITSRKKSEEATRWLAAIAEASWDAIVGTDAKGIVTGWNPGAERIFGYGAAEVMGKPVSMFAPPDRANEARELFEGLKSGHIVQGFETVRVRKDGSRIEVSVTLSLIRDGSGRVRGISGVLQDITERRAAEEQVRVLHSIALAASEAGSLEETLEVVLRLICQATDLSLANAWVPNAQGLLEARGQCASSKDQGRFRALVEGLSFEKGIGLPGLAWSSKQPAWAANFTDSGSYPRGPLAAELGIRAGIAVPVVVDDEVVAVIEAFFDQPRERDANLVQMLSAVCAKIGSVLQRKQAEEALRKSEEQLRQAQKMEAIGQLSGGIAHDFNNLLTVVLANADMLAGRLPEGDARREDVDEISKAAQSAAALTRQLLAFSRRQVLEPRVISLNGVVTGIEKMLRRLIGEHIEFSTALAKNVGHIYADAGQLEQVIMNLAVNARDAMPRGGKLRIDTMDVELDETYAGEHVPVKPGRYVMMSISDTGCGMGPETQSHIFEPFFTTKEKGKGTGLGLSTCYGIVKQSAGYIWVYSEPGMGSTFKIYLPRVDREADAASSHRAPATAGGSETILVVEDEESLRQVTRRILEAKGYSVLLACDGAEGIAMCTANNGSIDLILSDVVTPTLGGTDMAQRLRDQGDRTPVLFMSGYVEHMVPTGGVLQPGVNFIQKPFVPEALARKVREMLDGKKAA